MEELGKILRGKIVDGLECEKDLIDDAISDGEPMDFNVSHSRHSLMRRGPLGSTSL